MDRREIGGYMTFALLSKFWFESPASAKASSRIEYHNATGALLAPGIALCEDRTLILGDGRIEFRRRGDFGEREDFTPGIWSSTCDSSQVERLWDKLSILGPDSFPARVADPGDTIRYLTAYMGGQVGTLAIGPTDPLLPASGEMFMQEMYPVLRMRQAGECIWAVQSAMACLTFTAKGAEAEIRFHNPGTHPIGLVFGGRGGVSEFHFRFAQDREDMPYPEWHHCDNLTMGGDLDDLIFLEPGANLTRHVLFPCRVPDSGKYIGKISYSQTRWLDALAGYPVMTGIVYTEMAEFTE